MRKILRRRVSRIACYLTAPAPPVTVRYCSSRQNQQRSFWPAVFVRPLIPIFLYRLPSPPHFRRSDTPESAAKAPYLTVRIRGDHAVHRSLFPAELPASARASILLSPAISFFLNKSPNRPLTAEITRHLRIAPLAPYSRPSTDGHRLHIPE